MRGPTFTPQVRRGYGTHLDVAQHNLGKVGVHHLGDKLTKKVEGGTERGAVASLWKRGRGRGKGRGKRVALSLLPCSLV